MLTGEPGVGKTAIAEGLARRIEFEPDRIPVRLRDAQIVSLQMNALVAGTMLRGMFEERLQQVIREAKERPNVILFVDEAHTIVGAGSALGAPSDAAQILKSVLARGEIRMIAATTLSEYKEHIQEDEALARRFHPLGFLAQQVEMDQVLADIRRELERRVSPEFRNRIDEVVVFAPLTTDDVRSIAKAYLLELEGTLNKAGKTIEIDADALELIVASGYSMAFGARFLKRVIDERIKLPITLQWNDTSHFRVRVGREAILVDAVPARLAAA